MTFREYFCLFMAAFFFICFLVGEHDRKKTADENRRLRSSLKIEHNRANYFRNKSEHNAVFDFEKVNKNKEK